MLKKSLLTAFAVIFCAGCAQSQETADNDNATKTESKTLEGANRGLCEIGFETITGDSTNLAAFKGKVVLIVNVASKCGNTPQYAGLESLYEKYKDSGLVVIGFPANNFGGQEPGTNDEILDFCTSEYNVTFPMMAKISVKGDDKHPLYVELTEKSSLPGEITWNFSKFLLNRDGELVARFEPKVLPESDEVVGAIKALL